MGRARRERTERPPRPEPREPFEKVVLVALSRSMQLQREILLLLATLAANQVEILLLRPRKKDRPRVTDIIERTNRRLDAIADWLEKDKP